MKKLPNMKVTAIAIVIGALGTVSKGSVQGLEDMDIRGQVEIIQTAALLRSTSILRRVLETCGNLLLLKFPKPSANADVKNSQKNNDNIKY